MNYNVKLKLEKIDAPVVDFSALPICTPFVVENIHNGEIKVAIRLNSDFLLCSELDDCLTYSTGVEHLNRIYKVLRRLSKNEQVIITGV